MLGANGTAKGLDSAGEPFGASAQVNPNQTAAPASQDKAHVPMAGLEDCRPLGFTRGAWILLQTTHSWTRVPSTCPISAVRGFMKI